MRTRRRNIFENNIIVTDPRETGDFVDILINLNLVKELNNESSDVRHHTDTIQFMTIEVLRDISHTYRHDLESFLYVLL